MEEPSPQSFLLAQDARLGFTANRHRQLTRGKREEVALWGTADALGLLREPWLALTDEGIDYH